MKAGIGELSLIETIRTGWAPRVRGVPGVALGIGDDCAILRPRSGEELVVTTDFSLEGRHFRRDLHPARSVGHRVLARGLSDVAAMGARPLAAFLSLALPGDLPRTVAGRTWIEQFFAGLRALAEQHCVPLAGGDTSEAPGEQVLADIVLIGAAPVGRSLRRSGAKAGDFVYVTGALGGSAAELSSMMAGGRVASRGAKNTQSARTDHPHLFPQPRIAVGRELLRRRIASAAIDISDGLSTDLAHLCAESRVGAEVESEAIPVHRLARSYAEDEGTALELALHGGEDYEILFTAPAKARVPAALAGVPITRIGKLVRPKGMWLIRGNASRAPLQPRGWEHFSK